MAKRGLGKGLDALFLSEDLPLQAEEGDKIVSLRITEVEPNLKQPRKRFAPEQLEELAASVREHGIIQPIVVTKNEKGFYTIIAGERRWRAAKMAELKEIPAIIREYDKKTASEIALIENLQRENLNPMEEADGFRNLMDLYGMTQEEVSEKIGKSRSAVANALRLLALKEPVRELVREGKISAGHARTLLSAQDADQLLLAERVIQEGLSVRELERLVSLKRSAKKAPVKYTAEIRDIEDRFSKKLGAKVRVSGNAKKGKIEITYADAGEFERIMEIFGI
ncbi:MAG: ParB/RepB/Spo0J family partition protein [Ruminococcaceae bacterium]|nr:ParB/RepB/Spo0J family partition protein [Oscillospiraceae bacterium]